MGQTINRVLKSSDVEIEGRFPLGLEHPGQSGQNSRNAAAQATTTKVRMLENQPEFALMEVTCCCGRKTIIRCDYGGAAAVKDTGPSPEPNPDKIGANRTPEKKS